MPTSDCRKSAAKEDILEMSSASVETVRQCSDDLKNITAQLSDTIAEVTGVSVKVQHFVFEL